MRTLITLSILAAMLFVIGCSGDTITPITPNYNDSDFSLPVSENNENASGRTLWGMWNVDFDNGNAVQAELNRELAAHLNVTSMIPSPGIVVNSFDPLTNIVDVDFTISNPYSFSGYDVRLIIFVDAIRHKLTNADDWTDLYDISAGLPINPFKAFAKSEPNRIFNGQTQHTENLLIYLPGGNTNVAFAVDASYPSNCDEPYEITNYYQDPLYDTLGSTANLAITVRDWKDDTNSVNLYCPEITGETLVPYTQIDTETWEMDLTNATGASEGDYVGYILATSSGSGSLTLYDEVTISITTGGCTNQELVYDFADCGDPIDFTFECQGWVAGGCGLQNSSNSMGAFKWGCDVGSPCDMVWPYVTSGGGEMGSPNTSCDNIFGHGSYAQFNIVSPLINLPASDDGVIEFDHCDSIFSDAAFRLYISLAGCSGPWEEIWAITSSNGCNEDTTVDISGYSGDNVMFRFEYTSTDYLMFGGSCGIDMDVNAGVVFDDVNIYGCFMGTLEEV